MKTLIQLEKMGIELLAADPASPQVGRMWFNTTTNLLKYKGNSSIETVSIGGGGGGITAGLYAEYYTNTGLNITGGSLNSWLVLPFDGLVTDANSIYNTSNGKITIPNSYVGTCEGIARVIYYLNSTSPQTPTLYSGIWKNGTFHRYGPIKNNPGSNIANESFETIFKIEGVANDYFEPKILATNAAYIAGSIYASRIEISIFPK